MAESKQDKWQELRKAFPAEVVGKLPKGGIQLDFVGHAAVTDRLLSVDPEWSWEPLGVDEHGLPALDAEKNLWIQLTVCGVTRIGVGDGRNMKERIGDALRNAAMRFGVALDLWTKDELESTLDNPELKNEKATTSKPQSHAENVRQVFPEAEAAFANKAQAVTASDDSDKPPTQAQLDRIRELRKELGYPEAQTETKIKLLKTMAQAGASVGKLKAELSEYKAKGE